MATFTLLSFISAKMSRDTWNYITCYYSQGKHTTFFGVPHFSLIIAMFGRSRKVCCLDLNSHVLCRTVMVRTSLFLRIIAKPCVRAAEGKISWIKIIQHRYGSIHLRDFGKRCLWPYRPHRTHDLHSGSQDHHASKNSVQKTICCNSTSNVPDDGRLYPKHVELRIHQ